MAEFEVTLEDEGALGAAPFLSEHVADELPGADFTCQVCGKGLEYSGRGRHPKFCDEHRGSKSTGSTRSSADVGDRANTPAIKRIKVEIEGTSRALAGVLQLIEPFDAAVIGTNSHRIGETVGNVSSRNPKFKAQVEKFLRASSYPELLFLSIAIMQPILVHHGVIPVKPEYRGAMESAVMDQYAAMIRESGMGI
jgi:hypothetical protein